MLNIGIPYLPLWTPTLPNITKGSFSLRYGKFYEKSYTVVKRGCVRGACLSRLYSSRYFVTSSLASRCQFPFESAERGPPTSQQQQHTSWSRANPRQKKKQGRHHGFDFWQLLPYKPPNWNNARLFKGEEKLQRKFGSSLLTVSLFRGAEHRRATNTRFVHIRIERYCWDVNTRFCNSRIWRSIDPYFGVFINATDFSALLRLRIVPSTTALGSLVTL